VESECRDKSQTIEDQRDTVHIYIYICT
jgi:hypothetical protein